MHLSQSWSLFLRKKHIAPIQPCKFGLGISLIVLTAFTVSLSQAQDIDLSSKYEWKPVRIGAGGWMRGMAVSPSDSTRRYARGDVDNIYRWDQSSQQWYPTKISSALPASIVAAPTNAGGGAIAIDPQNPDHVMVAYSFSRSGDISTQYPLGGLNVYYSTDGARTFQAGNLSLGGNLSQETSGERLAIDPNNGNVAYLGSPSNGLYRTTDGGATWNQVSGGGYPSSSSYQAQHPRFDGGSGTVSVNGVAFTKIVYVTYINGSAGGVLKSADGGQTWTDVSYASQKSTSFSTVDASGNLWTSDGSTSVHRYSRAGVWTAFTTPHGGGAGIAVDQRNTQRIFLESSDGLSRSLNGGTTWTDLGTLLTYSSTQPIEWLRPSSSRPQGHYISMSGLYMDPSGNLWACTGNDGIVTTTPNDSTDTAANPPIWWSSSEGIEEMVAEIGVITPGGKPVLTVEDETLFTIEDPDTFTAQHYPISSWNGNNGLSSSTDISYAPNQPKYMAVLTDNLEAGNPLLTTSQFAGYSTDGGNTWSVFPSIENGNHPCFLYDGAVAISARAAGHVNDPAGADNLVWIPTNSGSDTGAPANQGPAPFYSKDGGATWTQTTSFNSAPGAVTVAKPSSCSAGPASYTFMGSQWGPWNFTLSQHLLVADPITPGTFYVDLTAGGFWKSTDGGVTWTQQAGTGAPGLPHHGTLAAVPGVSIDMWLVDGHEGATAHGLFHTTDGGNTFTRNPNFDYAWTLALGKAASGSSYPAIYVYGRLTGDPNWGVFQSIDAGVTFNRVSYYPYGLIDVPNSMTASWDVFGTVYIGFTGNSFYYLSYYDPADAPSAPVLSASAGDGQINLSWGTGSNGGTPTAFSLYRGTASGSESLTPIATVDGTTYSYTDAGLADSTTYYYYVTATNAIGTGPHSNEVSLAPVLTPPLAPVNVATFPGDGQIELVWSATAKATSYNIYRGTSPGGEGLTPQGTSASLSFVDTGLSDGTTYYYYVRAVDSAGPSAASAEVHGLPQAASSSTAQIAHTATPPALDGSVSAVWNNSAAYPMNHVSSGAIPQGQSNSAIWQGLWDANNLYIMVTVLDSTVIDLANNDNVEVYIDGNNGKAGSYTSLDWQYQFAYSPTPSVAEYSGGSQGTNTAGVTYGQAAIPGGYRIVAAIPWATLGVNPAAKDLIGIDVDISNFFVAGTQADKLCWWDTVDNDWTNPSLFGTAQLLPAAAQPPVLAAPSITPGGGSIVASFSSSVNVALGATPGATIRYTLDGSTPSPSNGTVYTAPIILTATNTLQKIPLKAVAYFPNSFVSAISAANFQIQLGLAKAQTQVALPVFSLASGTYTSQQTVKIGTATAGASIYYTTNGATPNATTGTLYTGPIQLGSPGTYTFLAVAVETGSVASSVASGSYTISLTVAAPSFSVPAGNYNTVQTVTISTTTLGATIYYTTNGRSPTSSSTKYAGPVTVSKGETLEAIAEEAGYTNSAVTTAAYTLTVAAPTFSPPAGTYTGAQSVSISTITPGATIYYTTNGNTPTSSSTKYTGAITVSASETVKAIAEETNFTNSSVSSAAYTIH
jgi:hypothetical protein